jgi:hypothetical protein
VKTKTGSKGKTGGPTEVEKREKLPRARPTPVALGQKRLIHELEVHHVELEMQKEELS